MSQCTDASSAEPTETAGDDALRNLPRAETAPLVIHSPKSSAHFREDPKEIIRGGRK
jgi:hypothetical protein